jgi:DNA-binding response OmpR family regulator
MSTSLDFSTSKALIYDASIARAQDTRLALRSAGFSDIRVTQRMQDFCDVIAENRLDLIIADATEPETLKELKQLRQGRRGENPFCIVMLLINDARADAIKESLSSGADDVLVRPFNPDLLKERIQRLVFARKPFVVSGSYVGPSRREHEKNDAILNFMAVPNTLRELGTRNEAGAQAAISWMKSAKEKLTVDRFRLVLLRMAAAARIGETGSSDVRQRVKRDLIAGLEEIEDVVITGKSQLGDLCGLLRDSVLKVGPASSARSWTLAGELSLAVLTAWREGAGTTNTTVELQSVVAEVKRSLSRSA